MRKALACCRIGDDISASAIVVFGSERPTGKPFSPRSIDSKLGVLRRFFTDLQDRPHAVGEEPARRIAISFEPQQFARTLKKANELDRIVDGLIDPQAATEG